MKCPRCVIDLQSEEHNGVILDVCASCGGIWFDDKEFNKLKEQTDSVSIKTAEAQKDFSDDVITCIKCQNKMDKINYMYSSGIIIDRCPVCDGIWLDGGEFKQLSEYLEKEYEGNVSVPSVKNPVDDVADQIYRNRLVKFFGRLFLKL